MNNEQAKLHYCGGFAVIKADMFKLETDRARSFCDYVPEFYYCECTWCKERTTGYGTPQEAIHEWNESVRKGMMVPQDAGNEEHWGHWFNRVRHELKPFSSLGFNVDFVIRPGSEKINIIISRGHIEIFSTVWSRKDDLPNKAKFMDKITQNMVLMTEGLMDSLKDTK